MSVGLITKSPVVLLFRLPIEFILSETIIILEEEDVTAVPGLKPIVAELFILTIPTPPELFVFTVISPVEASTLRTPVLVTVGIVGCVQPISIPLSEGPALPESTKLPPPVAAIVVVPSVRNAGNPVPVTLISISIALSFGSSKLEIISKLAGVFPLCIPVTKPRVAEETPLMKTLPDPEFIVEAPKLINPAPRTELAA